MDVDVHHGDGVQAASTTTRGCSRSACTSTRSRCSRAPGSPDENGAGRAAGTAVNVALPPGTGDAGWLRAFHAVVPSLLRAFRPQMLVTQCGADTHREDPLADLRLSVDGQRADYRRLRDLAEDTAGGVGRPRRRRVRAGRGGAAGLDPPARHGARPRRRPATADARGLARYAATAHRPARCPREMTDGADAAYEPWGRAAATAVDRAILATRRAVFPLLGLDPHDPRD